MPSVSVGLNIDVLNLRDMAHRYMIKYVYLVWAIKSLKKAMLQ
jgi:hypothetical protein